MKLYINDNNLVLEKNSTTYTSPKQNILIVNSFDRSSSVTYITIRNLTGWSPNKILRIHDLENRDGIPYTENTFEQFKDSLYKHQILDTDAATFYYNIWLEQGNVGTKEEFLAAVTIKGDKGDPFLYSDFTQAQKNTLKGDSFIYSDFTTAQIENLKVKGDVGYTPIKGTDYFDGADGYTPIKGIDYFDGNDGLDAIVSGLVEISNSDAVSGDTVFEYAEPLNVPPIANLKVKVYNEDGSITYEDYGGGSSGLDFIEGYSFSGFNHLLEPSYWAGEPNLVRLYDGNILTVYRKNTGFNHSGNDGHLVGRISADEGKTFGAEFIVYSDQYDERNNITGVCPNGDIIVVFRRSDTGVGTVDTGFVKSSDNGATWSTFTTIASDGLLLPFGDFVTRGTDSCFLLNYVNVVNGNRQVRIYKSSDNFITSPTYTIAITNLTSSYTEPWLVDIANGKSIIFIRNNSSSAGQLSYFQYNSENGLDFTFKGMCNIYNDLSHSARSPISVAYNTSTNELIVIAANRTLVSRSLYNYNNDFRIYIQDADDVFNDNNVYELKHEIPRPIKNDMTVLGYTSFIKSGESYFAITCDRKFHDRTDILNDAVNEHASLHTFQLNRITTLNDFMNYELDSPKLVIQNGYTRGRDYIDYDTISNLNLIEEKVKISDSILKGFNLSTSRPLIESYRLNWLYNQSDVTLTVPTGIQTNYQFQGHVAKGAILTIITEAGITINGEPQGTQFTVTGYGSWGIKYLSSGVILTGDFDTSSGATGTFTSADSKTVTVTNGIITSIV